MTDDTPGGAAAESKKRIWDRDDDYALQVGLHPPATSPVKDPCWDISVDDADLTKPEAWVFPLNSYFDRDPNPAVTRTLTDSSQAVWFGRAPTSARAADPLTGEADRPLRILDTDMVLEVGEASRLPRAAGLIAFDHRMLRWRIHNITDPDRSHTVIEVREWGMDERDFSPLRGGDSRALPSRLVVHLVVRHCRYASECAHEAHGTGSRDTSSPVVVTDRTNDFAHVLKVRVGKHQIGVAGSPLPAGTAAGIPTEVDGRPEPLLRVRNVFDAYLLAYQFGPILMDRAMPETTAVGRRIHDQHQASPIPGITSGDFQRRNGGDLPPNQKATSRLNELQRQAVAKTIGDTFGEHFEGELASLRATPRSEFFANWLFNGHTITKAGPNAVEIAVDPRLPGAADGYLRIDGVLD